MNSRDGSGLLLSLIFGIRPVPQGWKNEHHKTARSSGMSQRLEREHWSADHLKFPSG